jgi:hypothetical protein
MAFKLYFSYPTIDHIELNLKDASPAHAFNRRPRKIYFKGREPGLRPYHCQSVKIN